MMTPSSLSMYYHSSYFFFFSSRRRHTRSLCDWSSDVCSSDLFERVLYRRLYKSTDLEQVLLTIGLAFMAIATATYFYGPIPKSVPLPDWLQIGRASCRERV